MEKRGLNAAISRVTTKPWAKIKPRPPIGQQRKIAILGGAHTIRFAPFDDYTWELWSHHSCRDRCRREPDLFFDLHPPELWRGLKSWDPGYLKWLKQNHVPIYMQDAYKDIPSSMRYPFEEMITQFPRGYMTNTAAYMMALAMMRGATHIGVYGCHYATDGEYGPQRGSMEYWLGLAEGRGVHVFIPPTCDLLNRPHLLYGYQSHPNGKRDKSYGFKMNKPPKADGTFESDDKPKSGAKLDESQLLPAEGPDAPPLMELPGHIPATSRR